MRCKKGRLGDKKERGRGVRPGKRRLFCATCALFLMLSLLFSLSCSPSSDSYFAYADSFFAAEVKGELYGREFLARIERRPCVGEGGGVEVSVLYLAPDELAGIEVVAPEVRTAVDADANPPSALALFGELSLSVKRSSVAGWLTPVDRFLSLRQTPISRIWRTDDGFSLLLADGSTLLVDDNYVPRSLAAEDLSFEVIWLEWLD